MSVFRDACSGHGVVKQCSGSLTKVKDNRKGENSAVCWLGNIKKAVASNNHGYK